MKLPKELAKKVLAENLRKCLKDKNLLQKDFALSIGMLPQQFSFYIRGRREPDEVNLERMATGLGLPNKWELMRMTDNMAGSSIVKAWNALIDLHNLSESEVAKVCDYIQLLIDSHKNPKKDSPQK